MPKKKKNKTKKKSKKKLFPKIKEGVRLRKINKEVEK